MSRRVKVVQFDTKCKESAQKGALSTWFIGKKQCWKIYKLELFLEILFPDHSSAQAKVDTSKERRIPTSLMRERPSLITLVSSASACLTTLNHSFEVHIAVELLAKRRGGLTFPDWCAKSGPGCVFQGKCKGLDGRQHFLRTSFCHILSKSGFGRNPLDVSRQRSSSGLTTYQLKRRASPPNDEISLQLIQVQ